MIEKVKFKVTLRKMLKHASFAAKMNFFMCKDYLLYCFKNAYGILHCKNCVYLCIYDLFHILLSV